MGGGGSGGGGVGGGRSVTKCSLIKVLFSTYLSRTFYTGNEYLFMIGDPDKILYLVNVCHRPHSGRVVRKARVVAEDNIHVLAKHYELLPSGRQFRVPKSNTVSAVNSISEQINPFKRYSKVCVNYANY